MSDNKQNVHMLAIGNSFDGLNFIGPFDDFESAYNYSQKVDEEWTVIEVERPEDE